MFNLKFRKNTTRDLIMEKLDKDALLSAIQDLIDGRTSYLTEESVGCVEVADKWNELLDHIITEKRQEALNTNQLLGEVIRMDSMRSMLSSVGTQTDSLHIMASNSEELSASIQDVTNIIQETANFANNTHKDTQMGVKSTEELIDFVINSFEEIKEVNVELQQVKERTSEIIRIIDIVQGIAEQTNLLSLNAAIEAARAGENGRGFAVVAEEVRKLAEHTKESVEQVQEDILKLQRAIDLSVNQMDSISSKLDSGKSSIEETLSIINNLGNSVERIDDAITQIAANSEEQAASTETFAEAIENVSYEADFLSRNCRDTGLAIFNISKSIERVRSDVIKNKAFLKQEDMIETYKIDHLLWRWRVYNMLLGFENVDGNAVGNYKGCNLGCWYYSEDSAKCKDLKAFKDMEEVHILLHEVAKEAVDAFNKGDILTSEENLNKMDEYSRIIFEHLDEIKNNIISSGE